MGRKTSFIVPVTSSPITNMKAITILAFIIAACAGQDSTLVQRVKELESTLSQLSRQVMLQQFYLEEKIRSDGSSGIKAVRTTFDGTRNFYEPSHVGNRFCAIHEHSNYDNTVGMGEMLLTMNGVEFKTRHNDYKIRMPSKTQTYNAMDDIPFTPVPPTVLKKTTVQEQIKEMKEYFRAFQQQDSSIRDYKPYFKPVLCYVEGAWTTNTKTVQEPFKSDRHAIDASNWFELMEKVRYSAHTGSKSVNENYSLLPTTIMEVVNGVPVYAQWNYRILCHPLKDDLPLAHIRELDVLKVRFAERLPVKNNKIKYRRYYLNEKSLDHYSSGRSLLDKLMNQIPGKNNYGSFLQDNSFGMNITNIWNGGPLNLAYYHRYFKSDKKDAKGVSGMHRGFSDTNLWVAMTNQSQVAPMSVTSKHCTGKHKTRVCPKWTSRYSYALPLEIIYMNPLQSWNPYDLAKDVPIDVLMAGGRKGGVEKHTAYNGTSPQRVYNLTPTEFFGGSSKDKDPAATAKAGVGVLDKNGEVRYVASSGIRIATTIDGVGKIRFRYPIMPVHGEGSGVWKELNALKEMTMKMNRYAHLYEEKPGNIGSSGNGAEDESFFHYKTSVTHKDPPGEHYHQVKINKEEYDSIKKGEKVILTTEVANGHTHDLELQMIPRNNGKKFRIRSCDGRKTSWDEHEKFLYKDEE